MKFILKHDMCTDDEFISFWKKRYTEDKYSDNVYIENINIGDLLDKDNIEPLLIWKNGKNLSAKKSSIKYKIIENLDKFNDFRKLDNIDLKSEADFYQLVSEIISTGIVWKIFLFHMARPDDYPIFDQHVDRAYWFLEHGEVVEPPKTFARYKEYKKFFLKLVSETNESHRDVDKALMSFGQFLKSQFYFKVGRS